MDKIFISNGFNFQNNVNIGGKFTNKNSYIIGYWEASNILIENALKINHPYKDRLFFPICFIYRQFLELAIKQLIIDSEKIYDKTKYLNMQIKKKEDISNKIKHSHNIEKLLNSLIDILSYICDEVFDANIKENILEYHFMDETGQKFRYPVSTKNQIHFEK
jgi:hypothetical protein